MPHILRSDTAKGYGSAARTPRIQKTIVPRASFLGVPPEVRVYIHNLLFSKVELDLWYYLRPDFKVRPGRFTTAILRICRQVYAEAKPVLFENLELDFDYTYWMEMVPQIHEKIQNLVLPHLQKLRFPYSTFNDTELPVDLFRQLSPCLKVVHIGFVSTKFDFSRSQMYNAAVNNVQEWPMILGQAITPVSSFDHYLMNVALRKCGVLSQDNIDDSELITSLWLRDLLADESRKFTVTGSVHGCMRNKHGASLTVCLRLKLDTVSVTRRRIVPLSAGIKTVRDARLWAFGEEGWVLEGETLEQAEIEGSKLLADLLDSA